MAAYNEPEGTKLFVTGMPPHTQEDEIADLFAQFNPIRTTLIKKKFKGTFAFVIFRTPDEATKALDALNNTDFMDRALKIEVSHGKSAEKTKPMTYNLLVSGHNRPYTFQPLRDIFKVYGTVRFVRIINDDLFHVYFVQQRAAEAAREDLERDGLEGTPVRVELQYPDGGRAAGGGGAAARSHDRGSSRDGGDERIGREGYAPTGGSSGPRDPTDVLYGELGDEGGDDRGGYASTGSGGREARGRDFRRPDEDDGGRKDRRGGTGSDAPTDVDFRRDFREKDGGRDGGDGGRKYGSGAGGGADRGGRYAGSGEGRSWDRARGEMSSHGSGGDFRRGREGGDERGGYGRGSEDRHPKLPPGVTPPQRFGDRGAAGGAEYGGAGDARDVGGVGAGGFGSPRGGPVAGGYGAGGGGLAAQGMGQVAVAGGGGMPVAGGGYRPPPPPPFDPTHRPGFVLASDGRYYPEELYAGTLPQVMQQAAAAAGMGMPMGGQEVLAAQAGVAGGYPQHPGGVGAVGGDEGGDHGRYDEPRDREVGGRDFRGGGGGDGGGGGGGYGRGGGRGGGGGYGRGRDRDQGRGRNWRR